MSIAVDGVAIVALLAVLALVLVESLLADADQIERDQWREDFTDVDDEQKSA